MSDLLSLLDLADAYWRKEALAGNIGADLEDNVPDSIGADLFPETPSVGGDLAPTAPLGAAIGADIGDDAVAG